MRHLLVLILLGGLMLAPARAADAGDAREFVAATVRSAPGASPDDLAARLASAGAPVAPALFEAFRAGAVSDGDGGRVPVEPAVRRGLLLALSRLPEPVRALLQALAAAKREPAARVAGLGVLAEFGVAGDLDLAFALAHGGSDAAGAPAEEVEGALHATLERLLGRDSAALPILARRFPALPVALQRASARAIATLEVPAAVEALAQLLGVQPELDLLLLAELGRCASGQAPPFDSAVGSRVRGFLHAPSVELVREAAQACGRLEDAEALPELVELLGHENRGVRRNAHWSLRKITGVSFAEDPRAWGAWLLSEERWWDERAPELLLGLGDPDLAHALAAVQELARRRAPRHPLAREMVRALAHEEREVRRLACVALGQFRSRTAVPDLLAALEDPEADVRMAALRALRSITGLDLPGERAAWAKAGL